MSFHLGVLAIDGWTDVAEVVAMVDRCDRSVHVEGELDQRIVGFYERLRARFPDRPPYPDDCPWMSMPLDVGIDHVFMSLSFGERGDPALEMIQELATEYGLTLWDPQDGSAYRPVKAPSRDVVATWWRDLLDDRCSPAETHERVRPWVEEETEAIDDPITAMGVQHLTGAAGSSDGSPTGSGSTPTRTAGIATGSPRPCTPSGESRVPAARRRWHSNWWLKGRCPARTSPGSSAAHRRGDHFGWEAKPGKRRARTTPRTRPSRGKHRRASALRRTQGALFGGCECDG